MTNENSYPLNYSRFEIVDKSLGEKEKRKRKERTRKRN